MDVSAVAAASTSASGSAVRATLVTYVEAPAPLVLHTIVQPHADWSTTSTDVVRRRWEPMARYWELKRPVRLVCIAPELEGVAVTTAADPHRFCPFMALEQHTEGNGGCIVVAETLQPGTSVVITGTFSVIAGGGGKKAPPTLRATCVERLETRQQLCTRLQREGVWQNAPVIPWYAVYVAVAALVLLRRE